MVWRATSSSLDITRSRIWSKTVAGSQTVTGCATCWTELRMPRRSRSIIGREPIGVSRPTCSIGFIITDAAITLPRIVLYAEPDEAIRQAWLISAATVGSEGCISSTNWRQCWLYVRHVDGAEAARRYVTTLSSYSSWSRARTISRPLSSRGKSPGDGWSTLLSRSGG